VKTNNAWVQKGKSYVVATHCALAESYVNVAAREADVAAEVAASLKEAKFTDTDEPIAVETLHPRRR